MFPQSFDQVGHPYVERCRTGYWWGMRGSRVLQPLLCDIRSLLQQVLPCIPHWQVVKQLSGVAQCRDRRCHVETRLVVAVRKLMLQLNRLYPFTLQKWNSQHMILFLASPSFVLKNGRISGIVARAINFTLSTQLWVLLNTIKFALAVRRWLSTDFD